MTIHTTTRLARTLAHIQSKPSPDIICMLIHITIQGEKERE